MLASVERTWLSMSNVNMCLKTPSANCIDDHLKNGKIDSTLFLKAKKDRMLVVYCVNGTVAFCTSCVELVDYLSIGNLKKTTGM